MIRWLLRQFGFVKVDYGFATGRHWVEIDGVMLCQSADGVWLRDEDVHAIGYFCLDKGEHWTRPDRAYLWSFL